MVFYRNFKGLFFILIIFLSACQKTNTIKRNKPNDVILKDQLMAYLNDSKGTYDYIFIDCPPSLSLLTVMALVASFSLQQQLILQLAFLQQLLLVLISSIHPLQPSCQQQPSLQLQFSSLH